MPRLCLIADDLTGALDTAAVFAGRGLATEVALSPDDFPAVLASGAAVVAVSTRSREGSAAAAAQAVAQVVAALPAELAVFKKVDSRLKGHVAAELAPLAPERLLVAPALPEFGRLTRDGMLGGFGVAAPIAIAPLLGELAARATIPDVASDADLDAALAQAGDALPVGARGLAGALARRMTGRATATLLRPRGARVLAVIGSRDAITLPQIEEVRAQSLARWLPAPGGILLEAAAQAPRLLVQAVPGPHPRAGAEVAAALAASVHPRLTGGRDALILSGGATAEAVLDAMGITRLRLLGECLPGLPVARAGDLVIITKSGGFGARQTLAEVFAMLAAPATTE